jgi:hypothetical protein
MIIDNIRLGLAKQYKDFEDIELKIGEYKGNL